MRINPGLLGWLPSVVVGLAKGDDGLLRLLMRRLERKGIRVVGAHEIVPELLAVEGVLTKVKPKPADWRDIEAARAAAEAIGALDIGQGAVAIGSRVVALEGIEGTNGLVCDNEFEDCHLLVVQGDTLYKAYHVTASGTGSLEAQCLVRWHLRTK